jgi:hypothetical protein
MRVERRIPKQKLAGARAALIALACGAVLACEAPPAAPEAPAPPAEPPPADALEADLRALGREAASWMTRDGDPYRGELPREGATRDLTHVMQPGWCYKVSAVGGSGITDLDVRVFDGSAALVQRDSTSEPRVVVGRARAICPSVAGVYRIEVSARRGSGPFALQVHRSL